MLRLKIVNPFFLPTRIHKNSHTVTVNVVQREAVVTTVAGAAVAVLGAAAVKLFLFDMADDGNFIMYYVLLYILFFIALNLVFRF